MEYFQTLETLKRLTIEASKWIDTPWVPNAECVGKGVSCHNLPRAIYIACGALPADFPKLVGDPTQDRHSKISRMETFLNARPEFQRVLLERIQPGDLLGIRIHKCIDHLGLALGAGQFIHVLMHKHTAIDGICVPPWQQRIEAAWRPLTK
jgi:cell wall-associated NlpC family hydrolase